MTKQVRKTKQASQKEANEEATPVEQSPADQAVTDALLDEIDTLLQETNLAAAEFVQKGGQ